MYATQIVAATIFIVGLTGSLIGLYIKMVTDAALAKQKHEYLQAEVKELKVEVNKMQHSIVEKMDKMQETIQQIQLNISKLLNK